MIDTILVDADILLTRAAFACVHKNELGEQYYDSAEKVKGAVKGYAWNILKTGTELASQLNGTDEMDFTVLWFKTALNSKEHNFRYKVATILPYKGRRKEKPLTFEAAWGAIEGDNVKIVTGMEADDAICMAQHEYGFDNVLVVSGDKDMLQTPGHYYSMITQKYESVDDLQAHRNFWYQMITGDNSDNIPSLSKQVELKYGKEVSSVLSKGRYLQKIKKGIEGLSSSKLITSMVHGLYADNGLWENFNEIGELLHLKRFPEDSFQKRLEELK